MSDGDARLAPTARRLAGVAAIATIGVLVGLPVDGFVDGRAPLVVAGSVSVGAAVTGWLTTAWIAPVSAQRRRSRRAEAVLLAVCGLVGALAAVCLVALVWPGPAGRRDPVPIAVLSALVDGWSAIVTSPVPADASPEILIPLSVVVWGAVWSGVALRLRTDAVLAPVVPGVVAVVAASVAAGGRTQASLLVGLGLAAAAALAAWSADRGPRIAARRTAGGRGAPSRRMAAATASIVLVGSAVVGALLGPTLTFGRDDDPFDPRQLVEVAPEPTDAVNPIELVASWLQQDEHVMFTVGSEVPVRTRYAVLDTFDGATWQSSADYEPSGTQLATVRRGLVRTDEVDATIDLDALPGPWLPTVGDTVEIEGTEVRSDPDTQTIVTAGESRSPYTVTADVPRFDEVGRLAAHGDLLAWHDETTVAASAPLPDAPAWVSQMAIAATEGASSPFEQAARLEEYLRGNFSLAAEPVAGHAYGDLERALLTPSGGSASPEQFAATFAVVGRSLGLPTRVVVGFSGGEEVAAGVREVRGEHARVWPEVRFTEVGWVPFEPTPGGDGSISGAGGGDDFGVGLGTPDQLPPPDDGLTPEDEAADESPVDDSTGAPIIPPSADVEPAGSSPSRWLLGAAALATFVVLVLGVVVLGKRRVTSRRRRAGTPERRVIGAWHDVRDRLAERGVSAADGATVEDVVAGAGSHGAALTGLYRPVSAALYGDVPVTDDDAEQAWRARDRFVDACRRDDRWGRRVLWSFDPRPLWRR